MIRAKLHPVRLSLTRYLLGAVLALAASSLVATDVEAARLGGARSSGVQRSLSTNRSVAAPNRSQQAAPAQPAGAGAQAAAPGSRWLPLLGGLAIGSLLGSFFSAGGGLGGVLFVLLLVAAAALLFGALGRQRRGDAQTMRYAGAGPAYADMGSETVVAPPPSQAAGFEPPESVAASNVPADFDVRGFLRAAKLNFIKMQLANDRGDLEQIREFTTPQMYAGLAHDIQQRSRGGRLLPQQTDVVTLNADLLEVVADPEVYSASVRFSGMMQEIAGSAPVGFEEVWNLAKPCDGSTGWLLAGIQQMH